MTGKAIIYQLYLNAFPKKMSLKSTKRHHYAI